MSDFNRHCSFDNNGHYCDVFYEYRVYLLLKKCKIASLEQNVVKDI